MLLGIYLLALFAFLVSPAFAETKTITSEATYIMGDGETPDVAEARVLQKAKQVALEEAGTYVQSYTRVQNLDLTTEEIQTIAGGVLQVDVLEKARRLVAEGLRFYIKIKATVTTDKMEELARRIKEENVTEEYIKLQVEYARLSQELDSWKQRAATTPKGVERNAALDEIQKGEKAFARVQQKESELFQRFVSGQQLVEQASRDKEIVDGLIQNILNNGYIVTVGDIQAVADSQKPDILVLKVPLSIRFSEVVKEAVSHGVTALGGTIQPDIEGYLRQSLRIGTEKHTRATFTLVRIGKHPETARYFQNGVAKLALLVTFLSGGSESAHCLLARRTIPLRGGESEDDWFQLRRIFPISFTAFLRSGKPLIDNGAFDTDPTSRTDLNPSSSTNVAIIRDKATFVAEYWLPTKTMRKLTTVTVRALSLTTEDELYVTAPRCKISFERTEPAKPGTIPTTPSRPLTPWEEEDAQFPYPVTELTDPWLQYGHAAAFQNSIKDIGTIRAFRFQ